MKSSSRWSQPAVDRTIHVLSLLALTGIFIVQVIHISGGGSGHSVMARAQTILASYPEGQLERSLKQTVSTVENLHIISSRAKFIMSELNPQDVKHLASRFNALKEEDIRNTMGVLSNLNQLLGTIKAEDVGAVVRNTREISASLNGTRLNELIDATKTIEQRLKDLHEIRIKI